MYHVHSWADAMAIANSKATTTRRKQRVWWSRQLLVWIVREAKA